MRILFVSEHRRYAWIVQELRKGNSVDYVFMGSKWRIDNGDYHIPRLLGRHKGFRLLAFVVVHYMLLRKQYDFCVTDWLSVFAVSALPVIRNYTKLLRTKFIHDLRTIPVNYPEHRSRAVERSFLRQLRFANTFYQGITFITEEMKKHIEKKYIALSKPWGVWESGVDLSIFKPQPKNMFLKRQLGFKESDFVCFYHGGIGETRGIIDLVESFAIMKSRQKSIKLLLVGTGPDYGRVQQIIDDLSLKASVVLHDWVEHREVPEYISIADLCIIPLPDIDWWRVSSPLKLMEYIACGKTILLTEMAAHTNATGKSGNYFWLKRIAAKSIALKVEEAYRCFQKDPDKFFERGLHERKRHIGAISWKARRLKLEKFFRELGEGAS